ASRARSAHAIAVGVRPAVEAVLDDAVELARREVVAEQVAAVVGGEQLAGLRPPVEADAFAQPAREDLLAASVRSIAEHRRAARILFLAHVAVRAERDV